MQGDFQKIGLIAKQNVGKYKAFVKHLIEFLEKKQKKLYFDHNISRVFKKKRGLKKDRMMRLVDMIIVLGGDGTLLKTSRKLGKKRVPVLGVNMGHLGFLTETSPKRLFVTLERIFKGKYIIDERFLLRVTVYRNGKKNFTSLALNEAVINQGGFARLIDLLVEVNKLRLALYSTDGLIISSPTGSTGHSLSAGGPITHPRLDAFIITPICPVKLGFRPILIPNDRVITIKLQTQWRAEKKPIVLTLDGQVTKNLKLGDTIRIRKSSRVFQLIRSPGHKYYSMLRKKLNWGQ